MPGVTPNPSRSGPRQRSQSKELFGAMANAAPVMIWVSDPEGRFTFFNQRWLEFTGRSLDAEKGEGWKEGLHPEDRESYAQAVSVAFAAGNNFEIEYRLRRADGEYRWLLDTGVPMRSADGVFRGYIGSCIDITERRSMEESLRESEDRYRDLVENSGVLFGTHDLEGRVLSVNQATLRLAGCADPRAMIGRKISDFLAPATRHLFDQYLQTVVREGQAGGLMRVVGAGGEERILEYSNSLRPDSVNGPVVRCIGRDVTERHRGEHALKESEQRFRRLAENMRDIVWIVSADTARILYVNPAFERIIGLSLEGLRALQTPAELIHPDDRERAVAELRQQALVGSEDDVAFRIVRPDGAIRWARTRVFPIRDERGEIQRFGGLTEDITEREQVEQALREKNFELETAIAAKDRFLTSMSHELRTPLNAIIGFTGTLLMKLPGPLTEQQSRQLQTIRSSARHLLSLINDLLDLARIQSGRVTLTIEPVPVQGVVEEVSATLRPMAEKKGLELNVSVPEAQLVLNSDRRALNQILLNLTSNAIKFTERGEVRIRLEREPDVSKMWIRLSVQDTGIGISPEDQPKLFQVFSQVERASRHNEGTGLGLHLSQKLAELLGGRITLTSEYGRGSTFTLSLPEA